MFLRELMGLMSKEILSFTKPFGVEDVVRHFRGMGISNSDLLDQVLADLCAAGKLHCTETDNCSFVYEVVR